MEICENMTSHMSSRKRMTGALCKMLAVLCVMGTAYELPFVDYESMLSVNEDMTEDITGVWNAEGAKRKPAEALSGSAGEELLPRLSLMDSASVWADPKGKLSSFDLFRNTRGLETTLEMYISKGMDDEASSYMAENPIKALDPDTSSTSGVPVDPVIPDQTPESVVPINPMIPDTTPEPDAPDIPDTYPVPDVPDIPDIFPVPDGSDIPDTPLVPDVPSDETDSVPDTPSDEANPVPDTPSDKTDPVPDTPSGETDGIYESVDGFRINEEGMIYAFSPEEAVMDSSGTVQLPTQGCTGIASGTFDGVGAGIKNIVIPSNITYIEEDALSGMPDLFGIWIEGENPNYASVDAVLFDKSMSTLLTFPSGRIGIYEIPEHVVRIADRAFAGTSLSKIVMKRSAQLVEIGQDIFGESRGSGMSISVPRDHFEEYEEIFAGYEVTLE